MRRTYGVVIAMAALLATAVVAPSLADTEQHAGKFDVVDVQLERDWGAAASVGSGDPAEHSNAASTFAPCIRGMSAGVFPCDGVDMLSHVSHAELGTTFVNDMWGWTDPATKKDYALVGASNGTVFVDVSDAKRPVVLGILPTASTSGGSSWRDIKVYANHAYVVSEHNNHGVQVFDLTRLRDWDGTYTTYDMDAHYTGHGSAHNIAINEETGFAYSIGSGPYTAAGLANIVTVDPPSAAAGEYQAAGAQFGHPPSGEAGPFAIVNDGSANPTHGCEPLVGFPAGAIAVADRGTCNFTVKAVNAVNAGAVALVVVNNVPGAPFTMGGSDDHVTIPAVMVSLDDGNAIKAGLPATGSVAGNPAVVSCGTSLHMIDIREPTNPTFAGCFQENGYVHDTQCVIYRGPDTRYQGNEICFNSNAAGGYGSTNHWLDIVDVTDKANPVSIGRANYANSGYSHQGWLTPDQQYFLHGDEGDEQTHGLGATTRVWDVRDLENPQVIEVFENDAGAIDHNIYTQGHYGYAANYTSGLRVYDLRGVGNGGINEVAWFDVYPENNDASFEGGSWSNYPFFRQKGLVAVSSMDRGLFLLQPRVGRSGN